MSGGEIRDWTLNLLAALSAPRPDWSFAPRAGLTIRGNARGLVLPDRETRCSQVLPRVEVLTLTINDVLNGRAMEPWTAGGSAGPLRGLSGLLYDWGEPLTLGQVRLTGSVL
jgi:hypothetical protein